MSKPLVSVVELSGYLRRAAKLLSETERDAVVDFLAANPTVGVELGSGVRKFRWGPRGAYRIIHFFADDQTPVFLIDIYAKNAKANLSAADLDAIRIAVKVIR